MKKYYLAMRLNKHAHVFNPVLGIQTLNYSNIADGVVGVVYVFRTKTAARKVYGKNVDLACIEIE